MSAVAQLESLLAPAVEAAGYRLVRFRVLAGQRKTLQVMAERKDGHMDVEDCAALSRALSQVLDAADPIEGEYVLEVSSPGIERPLTALEDFARFAGHDARIELKMPFAGRRRYRGVLAGTEGEEVLLIVEEGKEKQTARFPLHVIEEAKLVLTEKLIAEDFKARKAATPVH
ncbi:MAG: ribosome maturation factor RimP [Alphaproteobacteria bacterium]